MEITKACIFISGDEKLHNLLPPETGLMIEDYEKKRRKQVSLMRSILDYGIGIVILLVGLFLFFRDRFDLSFNETFKPDSKDKIIGVVFALYGTWRIYRGYKKNYFK